MKNDAFRRADTAVTALLTTYEQLRKDKQETFSEAVAMTRLLVQMADLTERRAERLSREARR